MMLFLVPCSFSCYVAMPDHIVNLCTKAQQQSHTNVGMCTGEGVL